MNRRSATVVAALTAAGCSWGEDPAPAILDVHPSSVLAGQEAVLTISATELDLLARVDFDGGPGPVCDYFRIVLVGAGGTELPLEKVVRTGAGELRGHIPGSDAGVYDVLLTGPGGREAARAGAFHVDGCVPATECRDGNTCTQNSACVAGRCNTGTALPDGRDCTFPCTWGSVRGQCASGVCVPPPGGCPPPTPACGVP